MYIQADIRTVQRFSSTPRGVIGRAPGDAPPLIDVGENGLWRLASRPSTTTCPKGDADSLGCSLPAGLPVPSRVPSDACQTLLTPRSARALWHWDTTR